MLVRFALLTIAIACSTIGFALGQEEPAPAAHPDTSASNPASKPESTSQEHSTADPAKDQEAKLVRKTKEEMAKIANIVDQDDRAKSTAAGILQPIYALAESLAFPAFHWLAFTLMSAGVISYALQLVLGKLVVLTRMGFSLKEIISDAVGLAISVVGLVLTTQAAAENSTFTRSPAAVISATIVGALAGLILYRWGQSQEIEAALGRSRANATAKKPI